VRGEAPAASSGASHDTTTAPRVPSLPKHLERVLVRLSALGATRDLPAALAAVLDATIRDVDACLDASRGARGDARHALLERLAGIEQTMTSAAIAALDAAQRAALDDQVGRELSPYRRQMPPDALRDAEVSLLGDLARRHFTLPQVRLDG
jgi:hypothetical protein